MHNIYNPTQIELDAQNFWNQNQSFRAIEDVTKKKFYCLSMFPYPSGRLHMGHVRNYTLGDVISRHKKMQGYNVLQPMGWDAFGLPAENAAIKHGLPPAQWTYENIRYMKGQLQRLGFGYDWERELATCTPDYYKWEQWLFTKLLNKGLAYRKQALVNWDPIDNTVLANEQVIDGKGWRTGAIVEKRYMDQWYIRITDYAEELLNGLDQLDGWPEQVRTMQRNWIGRSVGVDIAFEVQNAFDPLHVFTTRPDTLMGVTYVAVAAEHPLTAQAATTNPDIQNFIAECRHGGLSAAELEVQEKRGIALGINAIHPISGELVPIFAANFVLMSYGTGAVMAVPAHDQRDWEFSEKYHIPKRQVIFSADGSPCGIEQAAYTEKGILKNSGTFDGLTSTVAFATIAAHLMQLGRGSKRTTYRLHDWGVSRQRYWGCPIPVLRAPDGTLHPSTELPVTLPEDVVVSKAGNPLAQLPEFYALPNGWTRETDTFDTFVESSWYYARYCCPNCDTAMLDERARYWLPVDQYVGGIEHAVLHLLYARFFHRLLRNEGLVNGDEPFTHLLTQGMVLAETYYRDVHGHRHWYNSADIEMEKDEQGRVVATRLKADGLPVMRGGLEKMSKSKNNGVDPQALLDRFGADTVRIYIISAVPPNYSLEWSDEGVEGAYRFINRLYTLAMNHAPNSTGTIQPATVLNAELNQLRWKIHTKLKKAIFDYERQQYNTVVAACSSIVNVLTLISQQEIGSAAHALMDEGLGIVLRLLAPIAPHVTHYLWRELGYGTDILKADWPTVDESALIQEIVEYVVQVNGRLRGHIQMPIDADKTAIEQAAVAHEKAQKFIGSAAIRKIIVVPGRLVNIVV